MTIIKLAGFYTHEEMKGCIEMKKALALALSLAMAVSLFAGCGSKDEPAPAPAPAPSTSAPATSTPAEPAQPDPITLTLSTTATMEEHHGGCWETLKAYVEEKCPWITLEMYYSSTLYDDSTILDAIMRGNCDLGITSPGYIGEYAPELAIFGACYLFDNAEQMLTILNGEVGAKLYDQVAESTGIRLLGAVYKGRRTINLRMDKEIKSREDMKGILMRVPNAQSWMDMGYALGCEPTAMALSEVYLALQAGTVDGQDNPLQATMIYGFGEVTKSITMSNHVIDLVWLCIAEDVWQSFDDETKAVFQEGFEISANECKEAYMGEEADLIAQFREMGLSVYEPDMSQMKEEVWEFYWANPQISGNWDKEVYDAVMAAA